MMNFSSEPSKNWILTSPKSASSSSGSSNTAGNLPSTTKLEERLLRYLDYIDVSVMIFALYTGIISTVLRNELFEQCPLYAKLHLRANATQFLTETIERDTVWGSVYTCEFASFAYLSSFVVAFIALWIHIVFRRVLRTERVLRLPIGISIFVFTLVDLVATIIVTDGIIKFCSRSLGNLCTSSGPAIFSAARWKIISLAVGGWLTTLAILLNTLIRAIQLFAKPKKSPEALKTLINQTMALRLQQKLEKDSNDYGSQISRTSKTNRNRTEVPYRPMDYTSNREFSPELYPYYYPPVPQYQQIKKQSRFQRICCPCLRRQRRTRTFQQTYHPFVIPEEYYHRVDHLKQSGTLPGNPCPQHSIHSPVEQQTQTDVNQSDEKNEMPFLGRRRSSVRFEDEMTLTKTSDQPNSSSSKIDPTPIIKEEEKGNRSSPVEITNLQRNVSFRNNEDDLWTTITIHSDRSAPPIQSSHYNRLIVENLSSVDTSIRNNENGVTAIHINNQPMTCPSPPPSLESIEIETSFSPPTPPLPPPPPPPPLPSPPTYKASQYRPVTTHRPRPPPPAPASRSHTTSSDDERSFHRIKPVEEINPLMMNKYNYNDLSRALKSNVERLKTTFLNAQEKQSSHVQGPNIRSSLPENHSSNC